MSSPSASNLCAASSPRALSQAFVPVLGEYRDSAATRRRASSQARCRCPRARAFVATLIGVLAAPVLVYLTASGFAQDGDKFALTTTMLRICFPYILFISLVSFSAGLLNTYGAFKTPAFTPVLLNLSFIAFALLVAPHLERPVVALAWAVFFGGLAQLLFQLPFLRRIRMLPRPRWDPRDEGVRRILRLMAPAVLGVSVAQLSLLINTQIASHLGDGPVSWLPLIASMEFPPRCWGSRSAPCSCRRSFATTPPPTPSRTRASRLGLRITLLLASPGRGGAGLLAVPLVATLSGTVNSSSTTCP